MNERIVARIGELQAERQQAVARVNLLAAELERMRHVISAYDGAIGELSRLVEIASTGTDGGDHE